MKNDFFAKTSAILQGPQKAALLYLLIGEECSPYILPLLTKREKRVLEKQLNKFTKLRNFADKQTKLRDDIRVLEDVYMYGKRFNILPKGVKVRNSVPPKNVSINANPKDIAKILDVWLSEGK